MERVGSNANLHSRKSIVPISGKSVLFYFRFKSGALAFLSCERHTKECKESASSSSFGLGKLASNGPTDCFQKAFAAPFWLLSVRGLFSSGGAIWISDP